MIRNEITEGKLVVQEFNIDERFAHIGYDERYMSKPSVP